LERGRTTLSNPENALKDDSSGHNKIGPSQNEYGFDPVKATILDEAKELIYGARQKSYGHPAQDFGRTALIWKAILGIHVTPEQVGLCLIGVKISREVNGHKRDSLVDIAGYAGTIEMIHESYD